MTTVIIFNDFTGTTGTIFVRITSHNDLHSLKDEINKNREQNFENSNNVSDNHKELKHSHTSESEISIDENDNNKASYNYEHNKDAIDSVYESKILPSVNLVKSNWNEIIQQLDKQNIKMTSIY